MLEDTNNILSMFCARKLSSKRSCGETYPCNEGQDHKLSLRSESVFTTFTSWDIHLWRIGHVGGCWSVSRNFSRPTIFVVHINQILGNVHNKFSNLIFETLSVTLFWRDVVLKCCSGHKFPQCALLGSSGFLWPHKYEQCVYKVLRFHLSLLFSGYGILRQVHSVA